MTKGVRAYACCKVSVGLNAARHHDLLLYKPTDAKVSFCQFEALKVTILTMKTYKTEPGMHPC